MTNEEEELLITALILPLWRGLSAEYKSRYRMNIWDQFGEAIRLSTYTTDLKVFFDKMTRRLPIVLQAGDRKQVLAYINNNHALSCTIMQYIRNQNAYIIMCVQVENDKKKQAYKERQEELF